MSKPAEKRLPRRKTMDAHVVGRADLGYGIKMPYRKYLSSDEWKFKRSKALRRDGHRCVMCFTDGRLEVHHITYARLGNERLDDLVSLCRSCHEQQDILRFSMKKFERIRHSHREKLALLV